MLKILDRTMAHVNIMNLMDALIKLILQVQLFDGFSIGHTR